MTGAICPICQAPTALKRAETPYWICPGCDLWYQSPQPAKVWHGEHEPPPAAMSEGERSLNRGLARALFDKWLGGKPGRTLDVGAALPVLASAFHDLGCEAYAIDGEPIPAPDLPVQTTLCDFEEMPPDAGLFDFVSIVHVFEHLSRPLDAIRKLRAITRPTGFVFLRSPDHSVSGFERDLTPGHFTIHPFYHSLDSISEALVRTGTFTIAETYALHGAGQRDFILRPL